jgi:hypothetical protein
MKEKERIERENHMNEKLAQQSERELERKKEIKL